MSVKGIPMDVVSATMNEFGWEEMDTDTDQDVIEYWGEGSLYGGRSEESMHDEFVDHFKKINKHCRVLTNWTYMDELPYDTYGSLDMDPLEETILEAKDGKI